MTRQRSDLEQRIDWTMGFRCATDKTVLTAIARWFAWRPDGTHVRFTVATLAAKSGVPQRSVERALERLEADWWIEVTDRLRGSRRPTTYRIVLQRLATADPDALTRAPTPARVADEGLDHPPEWRMKHADNRHSGGCDDRHLRKSGPDLDKVADLRSEEAEVHTDLRTAASSEEVRHSGGRSGGRTEHPDVPRFLAWATATYPQHASGATLVVDRDRDGHLVHGLLQQYPFDRLQAMALQCWTIAADGDPTSHATWIAHGDRSLRVLKHKRAFLERVVVGAQQLTLPPLGPTLSAQEVKEAERALVFVYGRCPHDPRCATSRDCVRAIALARRVG